MNLQGSEFSSANGSPSESGPVAKVKVRVKKMGAAQVTVLSAITRGLTMTIEELAMPIPDDRFMMANTRC